MEKTIKTVRGEFRIVDDGETLLAVSTTDDNFYFTFAYGTTDAEMIEDIEREFNVNN